MSCRLSWAYLSCSQTGQYFLISQSLYCSSSKPRLPSAPVCLVTILNLSRCFWFLLNQDWTVKWSWSRACSGLNLYLFFFSCLQGLQSPFLSSHHFQSWSQCLRVCLLHLPFHWFRLPFCSLSIHRFFWVKTLLSPLPLLTPFSGFISCQLTLFFC